MRVSIKFPTIKATNAVSATRVVVRCYRKCRCLVASECRNREEQAEDTNRLAQETRDALLIRAIRRGERARAQTHLMHRWISSREFSLHLSRNWPTCRHLAASIHRLGRCRSNRPDRPCISMHLAGARSTCIRYSRNCVRRERCARARARDTIKYGRVI